MAVVSIAACGRSENTPAPAASSPASAPCRHGTEVSARARRRCGRRAAVRRRLRRAAAATRRRSIWHLYQAALAGRDIYYDQRYAHNLEMRDVLEEIVTHPTGIDAGDARRDPALHEAVLDQHRPLQQPDRAQVRAQVHAGGVRRRGAGGRAGRRDVPARRPARRSTRCSTRLQPMFFDPDVDPIVTNKTPGPGKDILDGERQQPVRRRHDGGPRGLRGAATRSTRGS